jgi:hypothetical protein
MSHTWNEENNKILFDSACDYLKATTDHRKNMYGIELYVTPACNQKCEYCYLVQHGDKLYPKEIRDSELILKNLDIFLNFLAANNYFPKTFDIFSGEIWSSNLGARVLQKLLDFVKLSEGKTEQITIPSNFSFLFNEKGRKTMETFIEAFSYYDCHILLSCSYDGPLLEEENRPYVHGDASIKTTEEYAKTILDWCEKYHYGFHPMVNAYAIEKWPDQFKWWVDKMIEYNLPFYNFTMFLEVRNDEWTNEKIKSYLKYLDFAMDYTLEKVHNNNLEEYIKNVCCVFKEVKPADVFELRNYNGQGFAPGSSNKGCSVDRAFTVRLGDLAWVPCHRTSYEKLLYGKFIVENEKIVGMQALNIPLFVAINTLSFKGHMKCDICSLAPICPRGCFGAQMESHKEIFHPCESVCELFYAKYLFIYEKLKKIYFNSQNSDIDTELKYAFKVTAKCVENLPKEVKDRWMPTISNILSKT